jgi:hypothetical protein
MLKNWHFASVLLNVKIAIVILQKIHKQNFLQVDDNKKINMNFLLLSFVWETNLCMKSNFANLIQMKVES